MTAQRDTDLKPVGHAIDMYLAIASSIQPSALSWPRGWPLQPCLAFCSSQSEGIVHSHSGTHPMAWAGTAHHLCASCCMISSSSVVMRLLYAREISWNFALAASASSGCLSGCHCTASCL